MVQFFVQAIFLDLIFGSPAGCWGVGLLTELVVFGFVILSLPVELFPFSLDHLRKP